MKRPRDESLDESGTAHREKREKFSVEDCEVQLRAALPDQFLFHPSNTKDLEVGLRALKDSLDPLLRSNDGSLQPPTYLSQLLQINSTSYARPHYLEQFLVAWDHAQQENIHALLINIPATLAVVLRYFGRRSIGEDQLQTICAALTDPRGLKLFSRGLNHNKDFVVSPCLRLLIELSHANHGRYVRTLQQRREIWFHTLSQHLYWLKSSDGKDIQEDIQRPSIRTHAIRYFLALMRYSTTQQRGALMSERSVITALFRDLPRTPATVTEELMRGLNAYYVQDKSILPSEKSKAFSLWVLKQISCWYDRPEQSEASSSTAQGVHQLLVAVCSTPSCGLLREQWEAPPGELSVTRRALASEKPGVLYSRQYATQTLSSFTLSLKWHKSPLEAELLLSIFKVCPSLVHGWFKRPDQPLLSMKGLLSVIEQTEFLTAVIDLPLGVHSLYELSTEQLLDNSLPTCVTRKFVQSGLTSSHPLVVFTTLRLITSALRKSLAIFESIQEEQSAVDHRDFRSIREALRTHLIERLPDICFFSTLISSTRKSEGLLIEAVGRLLEVYSRCFPSEADDFSPASWLRILSERVNAEHGSDSLRERDVVIHHALRAISLTDGPDWYRQSASTGTTCMFIQFVKAIIMAGGNITEASKPVLARAVQQSSAFSSSPSAFPAIALIMSLQRVTQDALEHVLAFLNQSLIHFTSTSLRYHDELAQILRDRSSDTTEAPPSLIHLAILDQWPHLESDGPSGAPQRRLILDWIASYLAYSGSCGEDRAALRAISQRFTQLITDPALRGHLTLAFEREATKIPSEAAQAAAETLSGRDPGSLHMEKAVLDQSNAMSAGVDYHKTARQMKSSQLQEILGIDDMMLQLCCTDEERRGSAASELISVAGKLQTAEDAVSLQLWLLLKELIETTDTVIDGNKLPTVLAAFAAEAFAVLHNPLHPMYERINEFTNRGPSWDLDKIPILHSILRGSGDPDEPYYRNLDWLCKVLVRGLSTPEDLQIYGKRRVFEVFANICNYPHCSSKLRTRVNQLFRKAREIEGGSEMLAKRLGIYSLYR